MAVCAILPPQSRGIWYVLQSPQSEGEPSVKGRVQAHCEPATGCGPAGLGSAPAHRRPADREGARQRGEGAGSQEEGGAGLGKRREGGRARELVRGSY